MATPHVTGVAALAWSLAPTATAKQVAAALRGSAIDLGPPGVDNSLRLRHGRRRSPPRAGSRRQRSDFRRGPTSARAPATIEAGTRGERQGRGRTLARPHVPSSLVPLHPLLLR